MSQQTDFSDNEKKIYQLLYENPICECIKSNELNVLIDGNDNDLEAFRAVFWCGQYPDTTLNITICCDNIDECEKRLKTQMPAIEEFVNFKGNNSINNPLANVFLITELDSKKYDCVLNLKDISSQDAENKELKRLAENINFAYELKGNERAHFEEFNENDKKKRYKQKSSYASAVHITSKINYCEKFTDENIPEALEVLVKAINAGKAEPNKADEKFLEIYNDLVVLEHHRWMAYTISEGWKKPTKDELDKYLYDGTNDHKNKTQRYHACLHNCSIDDLMLCINEYRDVFDKPKQYLSKEIGNLKDVSLYCYALLCDRAKNIDITVEKINIEKQIGSEAKKYFHAVEQLLDDVENSIILYNTASDEIKNIKKYKQIQRYVEEIDKKINIVKERNKKTNFFSIDAQLIDLIPFCLWYRKKYKTVITISGGKIFDDIKVPLLLNSQNNIFITNEPKYKDEIENFFENYGDNAEIKALPVNESRLISDYEMAIDKAITETDVIISIGKDADPAAIMAVGKKSKNYTIVTYNYPEMIFYNNNIPECYCIDNKNLTVDEYMKLCQWNVQNQGEEVIQYNICDKMSDFFWDTSELIKPRCYNTIWEKLYKCYELKTENTDENKVQKNIKGTCSSNKKEVKYNDKVLISWKNNLDYPTPHDIQLKIEEYMPIFINKQLKECEIISVNNEISNDTQEAEVTIENADIYNILAKKSGTLFENIVYYKCKYSGLFNDVKTGVKIKKQKNITDNEIDVIATKGLCAVFISCKTSAFLDKPYIYEIASEADLFGGVPVIAVSQTLNERIPFVSRAREWGVSLLDAKIIKDDEKFNRAMKRILAGEIVSPLDAEFHTKQEDKK